MSSAYSVSPCPESSLQSLLHMVPRSLYRHLQQQDHPRYAEDHGAGITTELLLFSVFDALRNTLPRAFR
jgi:hypothetical protein